MPGATSHFADLLATALADQGEKLSAGVLAQLAEDAAAAFAGTDTRVGVAWRTVTGGDLHRHVFAIRCPDQAFFLDGINVYLTQRGIQPLLQQAVVVCATRNRQGKVTGVCPPDARSTSNEMLLILHLSATLTPDGEALYRDLDGIIRAVDISVRDFAAMGELLNTAARGLAPADPDAAALLDWMRDGKYLLFGVTVNGSRLGIMADARVWDRVAPGLSADLDTVPAATAPGIEWLYLPHAQRFLYATAQLEVVRITWRQEGALRCAVLVGYFSRSARHTNASQVPYLSRIWHGIKSAPELSRSAYLAREVRTLFDRMPKPLLLSVPKRQLLPALTAMAEGGSPVRTDIFLWTPQPAAVKLVAVVVPTMRFDNTVKAEILAQVAAAGYVPSHHYTVTVEPNTLLLVSTSGNGKGSRLDNLRQAVQECVITWSDRAREAIRAELSEADLRDGIEALARVPHLYTDLFHPETFVSDLKVIRQVRADGQPHVRLEARSDGIDIHIFTTLPVPLGNLVSVAQDFGLSAMKEVVVDFPGDPPVHLTTLHCAYPLPIHTEALPRLKTAFEAVLTDRSDSDPANTLVLSAGLAIDQVEVLIALRAHLVQLMATASKGLINTTLNAYPVVSAALYRLFAARHHPDAGEEDEATAREIFSAQLNDVHTLADDRWFRALSGLIAAGVRTNAYVRTAGEPIAVKVHPGRLPFAPRPVPYREIFVHGRHVEGVHLRGGPIARGGVRLSDRPGDYRTEVLELMATQVVKNSIIVPTGAKGGLIVRGGTGPRFIQEQYRAWIRALLSVTDNRTRGKTVPPEGVRIAPEDVDDPYLVVAADKGTATFSDLANTESEAAGFWLGDAFASGGSHGYDHKKYGITARGAWLCARHSFGVLGVDPERDPITAVGIGDMGGDVFGNGLLLSRSLKLVGAFNHQHIFLDPDPDPLTAYKERKRLFDKVQGWDGYDSARISPGGGVFPRTAKRIAVNPEAAAALGVEAGPMSGEELVRAILTAPVDLLYNGGIGTYVKASDERNEDVSDPVNNAVRVNGADLRCRVVAEGGNLGFSQRGRIEFARHGGRINTDAIDNAGGVAMSDREVNLKILLAQAGTARALARRNRLLEEMGEEVATLCLEGNLNQSRTLSLAGYESERFPGRVERLVQRLTASGHLNPETHAELAAYDPETAALRPNLAVLTGLEKNRLKDLLAATGFAGATPFRERLLTEYFPRRVAKSQRRAILTHPLAEEIVHTRAAGLLVDRFGLFAMSHLEDLLPRTAPADIAHGLFAADFILDGTTLADALWNEVKAPAAAFSMHLSLQTHLRHFAEELLRLRPAAGLSEKALREQRTRFGKFHDLLREQPVGAPFEDLCDNHADAAASGLNADHAAWLCTMPVLARCGVAVEAGVRTRAPLSRCLAAVLTVYETLPMLEVEMQLRSPAWGQPDIHPLQVEWLHRMAHLRRQAVDTLLKEKNGDLAARGRNLWHSHPMWPEIERFAAELKPERADVEPLTVSVTAGREADPTRVLLVATQLQTLIDDTTP